MIKKARFLLVVFLLVVCFLPMRSADAWPSGYSYRKAITITGGAGAGTNYQVLVEVAYDAHMQADFDDIRFYDDDGATPLDHWREYYTASTSALFWVEVADSLETSATIYMYYGNAGVSSASDGSTTFRFFNDFSSDPWTKTGSTVSVSGGYTYVAATNNYGDGDKKMFVAGALSGNFALYVQAMTSAYGASSNIRFGVRDSAGSAWNDNNDAASFKMNGNSQDWELEVWDGGSGSDSSNFAGTALTNYWARITRNDTAASFGVWSDRWSTSVGNVSLAWTPDNDPEYLYTCSREYPDTDGRFDYVFITKFIDGGCYVSNIGAEQSAPSGSWHEVTPAQLYFNLLSNNLSGWFILLGLCMIAGSPTYLALAKKTNTLSMDKFYIFLVAFIFGWALLIGGIAP